MATRSSCSTFFGSGLMAGGSVISTICHGGTNCCPLRAEIIFAGDGSTALCAEIGQSWDAGALVRYPNRSTFVNIIGDPAYAIADPIRMSALEEAVLQPVGAMQL